MHPFEKLGIDEDFNPFYLEEGIKKPTEIQTKAMPDILNNESVIGVAQTGSGKTLAYALPISELIKRLEDEQGPSRKKSKPQAIIVSPTKELAMQIQGVFKNISHHVKLRVRTLVGTSKASTSLKTQSYEILITTPNKLTKALKQKTVGTEDLTHIVFDEADQLFDMGFKRDIEGIMNFIDYSQTRTHFFSATMPLDVENFLDEKFKKQKLKKYILAASHQVQARIETYNVQVTVGEKNNMLKMFLEKTAKGRGIVFINQKNQVEEVVKFIQEKMPKLKYRALHGGLTEKERLAAHKSFVDGKSQVLIATDVAARGIDVKDLKWVFNYGLPKTAIYYLHRCGRVGRAGKSGIVYNFVTKFDSRAIALINDTIKKQSSFDIDLISKDLKQSKPKKKAVKKKTKKVKVTKRSRF